MTRLSISAQSLIIQCLAWFAINLLTVLVPSTFLSAGSAWPAAWAQGALAAVTSQLARQPGWWFFLHLVFAPLIVLALQAGIPTSLYFTAFVLLVLFYWSSFNTRVPLYLSGRKAWQAILQILPTTREFRFIDLGSGFGGVPLYLAQHCPRGRFHGTEIAPAPWIISRSRALLARSRARFLRRDYRQIDLAEYDVVFAFLSPAAMPELWRQAQKQMRGGSLFISLSFAIQARQADHEVNIASGAQHTLYVWRM